MLRNWRTERWMRGNKRERTIKGEKNAESRERKMVTQTRLAIVSINLFKLFYWSMLWHAESNSNWLFSKREWQRNCMGHYGLLVTRIITTSVICSSDWENEEWTSRDRRRAGNSMKILTFWQLIFIKQTDMLTMDVMQEINFKDIWAAQIWYSWKT